MNFTLGLARRTKWPIGTVLLVIVLNLGVLSPSKTIAQAPHLPDCRADRRYEITASPFFEQDRTLFLTEKYYKGLAVWKSTDDAATWNQVYSYDDPLFVDMDSFAIAPLRSDDGLIIYLLYTYGDPSPRPRRLLRSSDTGENWQERMSPCPVCVDRGLRATSEPDVLFIPRLDPTPYFGYPKGVARSIDGGLTWQLVWEETGAWGVTPSPNFAQDQTVFARLTAPDPLTHYPVIVSSDGGSTWVGRGQGLCDTRASDIDLSPDFANDQTVFVTMSGAIFRSWDAGLSWQSIYPAGEPPCQSRYETGAERVHLSPDYSVDRTIFMHTPLALFVSYDDGQTWHTLINADVYDFSVRRRPLPTGAPPALAASAIPHPGSAAGSSEAASPRRAEGPLISAPLTYQIYLPLLLAQEPLLHPLPLTLFVSASRQQYRSDDGGITWACLNLPPTSP